MKLEGHWAQEEGDRIRDLLKHEGELLNHRMGWLLTINSVSLTGVCFAWESFVIAVPVFAFIGIGGSTVLALGMFLSAKAANDLARLWEKRRDPAYEVPVIGMLPRLPWSLAVIGFFPIVLICIWVTILFLFVFRFETLSVQQ